MISYKENKQWQCWAIITCNTSCKNVPNSDFLLSGKKFRHRNCEPVVMILLTPWCRVFLEKLTGLQLVKKFPAFYGIRKFITALTSVRHPSLSWVSPTQSIYQHPTSWRSVLILSTLLRLGLPSGLFPSGFPTKNLYAPLSSPICIVMILLIKF